MATVRFDGNKTEEFLIIRNVSNFVVEVEDGKRRGSFRIHKQPNLKLLRIFMMDLPTSFRFSWWAGASDAMVHLIREIEVIDYTEGVKDSSFNILPNEYDTLVWREV